MIIAVDFDGTLAVHKFPKIGREVEHAFDWLKKFQEAGAKLILWTMRCDGPQQDRKVLSEAVEFCRRRGIEFWGVNTNPEQHDWTSSNKAYAHLYIDDAAFGCPLIDSDGERPYVDWRSVGPEVYGMLVPDESKMEKVIGGG